MPGKNEEDYFDERTDQYGKRTFRIKDDDEWRFGFEFKWGRRGGKRKSRNKQRKRRTRRR